MLYVKKLSTNAMVPQLKTSTSVEYDLFSAENVTIPPNGKAQIKTDLAIQVPLGTFGKVTNQVDFAWNKHVSVVDSTIRQENKDNVLITMFNHSDQPVNILVRTCIAQLMIEKILTPKVKVVEELPKIGHGEAMLLTGITEYPNTC